MKSSIFVLVCVNLLLTGKQPRNVLLVSIVAASSTTQATNNDPGPPKESCAGNHVQARNSSQVKFRCCFSGNPLPSLEWKFSNGSKLPNTSQFLIGSQQQLSQYEASLQLTVYGTGCNGIFLYQFQCFATNLLASQVKSNIYTIGPGDLLFHPATRTCSGAIQYCENKGTYLPVASNMDYLKYMGQLLYFPFWISADSVQYFPNWSANIAQAAGCVYVDAGGQTVIGSDPRRSAVMLCEAHPSPHVIVTHHVDECNGTRANISWNIQPGAESLGHKIFYGNNRIQTVAPGLSSAILTDLRPNSLYNIYIVPLFEGCSRISFPKNHTFITGRGILSSPTNVTLRKISNICHISWNIEDAQDDFNEISVRYVEMPSVQMGFGETQSKIYTVSLNKSARQHNITDLVPNTNYKVYVGAVPSSPCQDRIPVTWSKNFTGSCVTELKGPSSVPLSNKPPVSVAGRVQVSLEPVSERNGLISCCFVVVQKVVNGSRDAAEWNITKLRQGDHDVKDGDSYVTIAVQHFSQTKNVTLGDSTYSCCDVTDTSGISKCSFTSSHDRNNVTSSSVVYGHNRPLTIRVNYTYYVITATPVRSTSGHTVIIYTASHPHQLVVNEETDFSAILLTLAKYIIVPLVPVLLIMLVIFICIKRQQNLTSSSSTKKNSVDGQVELQPVYVNTDRTAAMSEYEDQSFESSTYESIGGNVANHVYETVDLRGMVRAASEDSVLSPIS